MLMAGPCFKFFKYMFLEIDKKPAHHVALLDGADLAITYGELSTYCTNFGDNIQSRALLFILCTNSSGAIIGFVGAVNKGAVPLLLSADIDAALLGRLYETYKPQYLWVPSESVGRLSGEVIYEAHGFSLVLTANSICPIHQDLALLLPTSGSTGSPKLVRHSYTNLSSSAKNVASFFEISPDDRPAIALPMQYTMGLSVITSHLWAGATLVLFTQSLTDPTFWRLFKEHKVTSFTGVPYSFEILAKLRFFRMDLPHLKLITQGGGKLKEELFVQYANFCKENGKRFIATYGQTEGTARMAFLPAELSVAKTGSIGRAIPGGQLSLLHDDGSETIGGEATGEMMYRGPNVTLGYAQSQNDLMLGDVFNGVLSTGDLAKRDADGCYFILGRLKRFLKLYGLRIGLDECEWLISNEFNAECLCAGNDEKMQVYITDEACKDLIIPFLSARTGLFIKAIEVIVVDEIPRAVSGKPILNVV